MTTPPRRITIDDLPPEEYARYAHDQAQLHPHLIRDARYVPPHTEIVSTSGIYFSQLEALFYSGARLTPWARFVPPPSVVFQTNRFFTSRAFPYREYTDDEAKEGEEQGEPEEEEEKIQDLFVNMLSALKRAPVDEKEQKDVTTLMALIREISKINQWLIFAYSRKLQFQKG